MTGTVVGAVPAADRLPDAHLLAAVDGALAGTGHRARRVSTHVDRSGPVAVTAVALDLMPADPPPAVLDALTLALGSGGEDVTAAVDEALARTGGRCVRFVGQEHVTGEHTVAELLAVTEIDEVVGVGRAVAPGDAVATAGFLRPQLLDGRMVLLVEPAAGGRLRPVEVESPHQCCGGAHG